MNGFLTNVRTLILPGLAALVLSVAGGCANKGKKNTAAAGVNGSIPVNASVTDITPVPMSEPAAPAVAQAPANPIQPNFEPVPAVTETPAAPAAGGSTYVVKKGDTLFAIARSQYGDGKQWQRIAAANPNVNPNRLLVGQTITLP